jgi:predicted metalloprotease
MTGRERALLVAATGVVLAVMASGCTVSVSTDRSGRSDSAPPSPSTTQESPGTAPTVGHVELRSTPGELPATLAATTRSLREYWSEQLPAVYGRRFQELRGGFQATTESSEPWRCGGQRLTYTDVRGNAFYCGGPQDDYIAYDDASLLPQLNEQFGSLTPSVVLAHEMGHAVQARAGVDAPSVVRELQADCFAGAWVAFAQHSSRDPVSVAASALDSSVRALPALRDQPGTAATNAQAHGLAFDRVNAYQTGYESGASRCARFPQGDVVVTELPFQTVEDAQSGGNLPYPQTVQFAVESLDGYWPAALPGLGAGTEWQDPDPTPVGDRSLPDCPGDDGYDPAAVAAYCASSNTVAWSDPTLAQVQDALGDVGAASALSLAWARSGQVQAGIPDSGVAAQLQQVCATGAWLSSVGSDSSAEVELSPGDIDEGLFAALSPLAPGQSEEVEGSSFERADAYRKGLLGGLERCVVPRR